MKRKILRSHRAAEGAHHWQYSTSCRENWSRASSKARHPGLVFFWKYWGLSNILFSQFVSLVARKFPLVARKLLLVACFPQALLLLIKNQTKPSKQKSHKESIMCFTQRATDTELFTRLSKLLISLDHSVPFLYVWNLYLIYCTFQVKSAKMILHSLWVLTFRQNLGESILYLWVEKIREVLIEKAQSSDPGTYTFFFSLLLVQLQTKISLEAKALCPVLYCI